MNPNDPEWKTLMEQYSIPPGLPLRVPSPRTHDRVIIGFHLIFHGYGHWVPNDIRGSGSTEVRSPELEELGLIHFGRKKVQPSRDELREFYREVNKRLKFKPVWYDGAKRQAIGDAFAKIAAERNYTVYAFASMWNHAHAVVRRHRDDAVTIWGHFAEAAQNAIRNFGDVDPAHPVWSDRPYMVFLYTPDDVRGRIRYVEDNPEKEKLPLQHWPFVKPYDGWPTPNADSGAPKCLPLRAASSLPSIL